MRSLGENRITSPLPQLPPRPEGASASDCGGPPRRSIFLSLPSAKKPRYRAVGRPERVPGAGRLRQRSRRHLREVAHPDLLAAVARDRDERELPAVRAQREAELVVRDERGVGGRVERGAQARAPDSGAAQLRRLPREPPRDPAPRRAPRPAARGCGAAATASSGTPACEPASPIQRSSLATSWALCQRSSGSFSRHFARRGRAPAASPAARTRSAAAGSRGWPRSGWSSTCPRRRAAPSPSRRAARPARRCRSARRLRRPRAARAPCTGTCRGPFPRW